MKRILILSVLLFVYFFSYTQDINKLLYKKINDYRKSNNLPELTVCDQAKIGNTQQLNYMVETSTVPLDHTQKIETSYGETFNSFEDRINSIYGKNYNYVGENLIGLCYDETNDKITNKILTLWENSPGHNEILLSEEPKCFYINYKITNKIIVNQVEYINNKIIYCVLTTFK
jgi:uncharacterized protein YkwD